MKMKINFKQAVNGLIRTTTLTAEAGNYFSIQGAPVTYGGTNFMPLHLHDATTGLPRNFRGYTEFNFRDPVNRLLAQRDVPTLTDEQWETGCRLHLERHLSRGTWYEASADRACQLFWGEISAPAILYWENLKDIAINLLVAHNGQDIWLTEPPETLDWAEIDGVRSPVLMDGNTINTGDEEFVYFQNAVEAGKAARKYWVDMAANNKSEFVAVVEAENLIEWALGNYAGPGPNKVASLSEWFDLQLDPKVAAAHHAGYDGVSRVLLLSPTLAEIHGEQTVCYRIY